MTAIKKFMSDVFTKIKDVAKKIWAKIKATSISVAKTCAAMKNKYVYLLLAFALVLSLFASIGLAIDSRVADIELADGPMNEYKMAWHYAPLYTFLSTYEERYNTYLDELERFENGEIKKKPSAPEYKYETAMADRIIEAAQRQATGEATAMDTFWLTTGINTLNSLSGLIYNQNQTTNYADSKMAAPFFSLFQIIALVGLSIAMIVIVAKSTGRYNIGFAPLFTDDNGWYYLSLATLILTIPSAIYSLIAKSYTWSLVLFLAFVMGQVTLAAFAQFTLRKHGMGKMQRFLISTGVSYGVSLVYFLVGMLNGSEYGTFGVMSLYFPQLLIIAILVIAPLWVNAAYMMNGSIMATALPYACFGVFFAIFPGVILTIERHLYAIVLFYLAFAAFIVGTLFLTLKLILLNKKNLPFPADVACEMYEEGAPEITVPEEYTAAVTEKKTKKAEKKAAKNDFAFLDETEKTETENENTNA